jgi:hypothetical protein
LIDEPEVTRGSIRDRESTRDDRCFVSEDLTRLEVRLVILDRCGAAI